jgi:hypothetical protein
LPYATGFAPESADRIFDSGEHPLQIPTHRHQSPLALDVAQSSQEKLSESQRRFDDAKDRFGRLLVQGIKLCPLEFSVDASFSASPLPKQVELWELPQIAFFASSDGGARA